MMNEVAQACGGAHDLMVHVASQRVRNFRANLINEQIAMSSHVSDSADLIS